MDFLKELAGQALGGGMGNMLGGGRGSVLIPILLSMIANRQGGLGGLLQGFQQRGLGDAVGSWVSRGPNTPISPDQVHSALGQDQIAELAQQSGLSEGEVQSEVASILPQMVDNLTPEGQVPEGGYEGEGLDSLLGRLTGGR